VVDLAECLISNGRGRSRVMVQITIIIDGVESFAWYDLPVMPDRIETGILGCAAINWR